MTPEQRIAELAAQRGGVATYPRPPRESTPREPSKPARPNGFNVSLPASWRQKADDWGNRDERQRLMDLETYLAAGVIVRYLGAEWHRKLGDNGALFIVHSEGYGIRFKRDWQDKTRFNSSALEQYKRDEPATITTSAARPLGAIAADIERRIINNGLREAYLECRKAETERREERRERFRQITAVAAAWGGRISDKRSWTDRGYPEASIPGGTARIGYGFNGKSVEINLSLTADNAVSLAPITMGS